MQVWIKSVVVADPSFAYSPNLDTTTDLKKRLDRASVVQKMKPAEMRGGYIGRSQFAARRCKAL